MTTVIPETDNARRATPKRRHRHTVEEVEHFLRWTLDNSYAVARALGIQRESLHRALERVDRLDLWRALAARDVSLEPEAWHSKEWLPESDPRRQRRSWPRKGSGDPAQV